MDTPITRRQALVVGTHLAIGAISGRRPARTSFMPPIPRFTRTLYVPPILEPVKTDATTDYYEIAQRSGSAEILPGIRTPIWGFQGTFPGPTIRARRGRPAVVLQTNYLAVPTAVHLHGGAVPADSDGFPTDVIAPGASRTYVYPNDQCAATLWYHDHALHRTGRNVYMGLAGLYVIDDPEEKPLNLPSGMFDVPLLIQNRSVRSDGRLEYDRERNLGADGDIVLVNGVPWPRMPVCARRYRFRVVNGANASVYRLALNTRRPLVQVASDLGLLPAPLPSPSIPIAMAERVELVIDFSPYPIGSRIVLQNLRGDGPQRDIMCFDVVCSERDTSTVPEHLGSVERISLDPTVKTREFVFTGGPSSFPPVARWTINGVGFDADRAIATPQLGDAEVWRFVNRRRFGVLGMIHPVHVHLVRFQVIERNGGPPNAHDAGWKDTVAVHPGEDVRIALQFEGHRGRYLIHCHNLEHEDHDMMARYDVV
jgi:FtsP/CotA-like multicopper oxidase with cupredoxin domain